MAGNIKRPSLKDLNFDLKTIKFIKEYALQPKGDDKLLLTIVKFFEKEGFKFMDWKNECKDLFINEEFLTSKKPSKEAKSNRKKGLSTFEIIGRADISQSIIIQNNIILGIEAAEGTDELIKRCYKYKKKGDKGILLKLSKYNQDTNLDIPVIGLETVKNLSEYDYDGVFLERDKCIIIDREEVIKFCNLNHIFIATVVKN